MSRLHRLALGACMLTFIYTTTPCSAMRAHKLNDGEQFGKEGFASIVDSGLDTVIVDGAEWPWSVGEALDFVVKVLVRTPGENSTTLCTGSLLPGGHFVLTAAHCVLFRPKPTMEEAMRGEWPKLREATQIRVQLADGSKRGVYKSMWHPEYSGYSGNDVAVLAIENTPFLPFSTAVSVEIARSTTGMDDHGVYVAGFGATAGTGKVGELKLAYLAVEGACPQSIGEVIQTTCVVVPREGVSMSPQQSTCQGDSGAPFFTNPDETAIVGPRMTNWKPAAVRRVSIVGVNSESMGKCGEAGKMTSFIVTSSVSEWIANITSAAFVDVDFSSIPTLGHNDAVRPWSVHD